MRPTSFFTDCEFQKKVEREPEKRILWKSKDKEPLLAIREKCINVIASRVRQNNLNSSMRIGLELACRAERDVETWVVPDETGAPTYKNERATKSAAQPPAGLPPVKRVLYVNTYAMLSSLREARDYYVENMPEIKERRAEYREYGGPGEAMSGFPLLYCDAPMDQLVKDQDQIRKSIVDNEIDVIILNSFEKAATSSYDRKKLVNLLTEWQADLKLTVIVYTTEVRKHHRAGVAAWGALGNLVGEAGSYWFVNDDRSEIFPYVEQSAIKETENEFRTRNNYKRGETRPEPTSPIQDAWERTLFLLSKGSKRTWEEEKELSPFTVAAMEERGEGGD